MRESASEIACFLEQVRAHGVQPVMCGQLAARGQLIQQIEPCGRAVHHRDRNGTVERHHRIVRHPLEHGVKRQNLRPISLACRWRFVVNRGNRRLKLIRTDGSFRQRAADERESFGDGLAIPQLPILLVERYQFAVRTGARRPSCVGQQHQRKQPGGFRIIREPAIHRARQPNRLA